MQQYTMRGYIARDKHEGDFSDLYFGVVCPKYDPICEAWHGFGEFIALPKDWYPELKYTDKPIAVELIIKQP